MADARDMSTILQSFQQRAATRANTPAFVLFGDITNGWSWSDWERDARYFAAALVDSGCTPGSVVAVLAGNRPVWPIADLGALMAGAISVGVYPTSAAVQVHEVLNDSAARIVVVDTSEQLAKVLEVRAGLPNLRSIVCACAPVDAPEVIALSSWLERGRHAWPRCGSEVSERIADASPDDVAILIYTSGSTGVPKGARISHRYLTASAESIRDTLALTDQDSSLSFLPYCHASERVFGLYTRILTGMRFMLVERPSDVWAAARAFGPTLFGGLPRFYEKIYEALLAKHATLNAGERMQWDCALQLGRERSLRARDGAAAAPELEHAWLEAATLPRETIASLVGRRVRLATSGGATLATEVAEYLAAAGLTVLGAYGLTEHLCVAMHRPDSYRFDSAGMPMPGTDLRISDTGEIQLRRSALTFSGYQHNAAETRAAFTSDGAWLRTGDLGFVDAEGRLHVTGREKELIALSGGKKVAPVPIERRLSESPWIAQAVLFGENRRYISALIALRRDYVEKWARETGRGHGFDALLLDPEITERVQHAIDAVNQTLSRPEQIKRFALLPAELSMEGEELTPTLKVRRSVIAQKYQEQLESLYR
jgi:long-chain acyl-CoA synthetase